MVLEALIKLSVTEPDVLEKTFFAPKFGGKGPKTGFFEFNEKFGH